MTYKTILTVIQSPDYARRVLDCAVPLAARLGSHIIGIHAEPLPVPYAAPIAFPDAGLIEAVSEANKERSTELEALFRGRVDAAGLSSDWRARESFTGDSAISALYSARAVDLVVAAQPDPDQSQDASPDVEALLFDTGRPVLIAPFSGGATSTFGRVVVAWNGSREAARATFDALPFLLEAETVEILVVDPEKQAEGVGRATGTEIAATLSRHGVKVSVATEETSGRTVEDVIEQRVVATGADLLVLGAYGHSWLRELLFGGVSRSALRTIPVSTFMSR